ncbi:hypothetical protein EfmAA290_20100 [Enterococcus faecium]|nr:hypothetical protein EfmAA290_20100 [Enterococcus faecium]
MNDFTTEIVQTLVTKGDLNELFRSHFLQYAYFDFFSNNVKDYFRQSIVGRLGFQVIRETVLTFDQSKPNMVN